MEIIHVHVVEDGAILKNCFVRTGDGRIREIGPMERYVPKDEVVFDGEFQFLCPGFIDIHNHGALGFDVMDGTAQALSEIARFHLEHGVTSFLATTMTGPLAEVKKICGLLDGGLKTDADILGLHLEGPFLSKVNKGAQPEEYLLTPEDEHLYMLEGLLPWARLITVSPDIKDAGRLIRWCARNGVVVSGGHDGAIEEEIYQAIDLGMRSVTHLYCCSSSISRRNGAKKHIGLTEIGLEDDRLFVEVIADGHHVPDPLFRLIYRCKGFRKICLVSDEIRAAGLGDGDFLLGGAEHGVWVRVKNGVAFLKNDKAYAGSVTPVCSMVEHLAKDLGIPLEQAVYMASSSPAALLSLTDRGHIREGFAAHFNLLHQDGRLLKTIKE